jgi:hypothetical protein
MISESFGKGVSRVLNTSSHIADDLRSSFLTGYFKSKEYRCCSCKRVFTAENIDREINKVECKNSRHRHFMCVGCLEFSIAGDMALQKGRITEEQFLEKWENFIHGGSIG